MVQISYRPISFLCIGNGREIFRPFFLLRRGGKTVAVWPFFGERPRRVHISTTHLQEKRSNARYGGAWLPPEPWGLPLALPEPQHRIYRYKP